MGNLLEKTFEEKKAFVSAFNVIDDTFFHKVVEDRGVCEEILRVIIGDPAIKVIESRPQMSLRNTAAKSVVLDVLCEDASGRRYNVEVQKSDDDDHVKRARYNQANIDTMFTEKGINYRELPDVYIIFITKFDIFKSGKTVYHIGRRIEETGMLVDNGAYEIYVTATGKDDSEVTELMRYFLKSEGKNKKFPRLSNRVDFFKNIKEGVNEMCEISDRLKAEGREEGKTETKLEIARVMADAGENIEKIMQFTGLSKAQIEAL